MGRHVYDGLSEAIGEDQHVRLAYDGMDLELMTTGYLHERYKELLGQSRDQPDRLRFLDIPTPRSLQNLQNPVLEVLEVLERRSR